MTIDCILCNKNRFHRNFSSYTQNLYYEIKEEAVIGTVGVEYYEWRC